jgi:hypothetical protein
LENLKKLIKSIVGGPAYQILSQDGKIKYAATNTAINLRRDMPPLPYDRLLALSEEAYLSSENRKDWCDKLFGLLDKQDEYQNFIKINDLLKAAIAINVKYVELDGPVPSRLPSNTATILVAAIADARQKTIAWAGENILKRFLLKNIISEDEKERFVLALDKYLIDYCHHISTDAIPDYFRETMPEETHKQYLENYKYVFETLLNKSLEYFLDILRNDPAIRGLWNYL